MAINLPWFPDGDTTAPVNESVYHRFFSDYYQTYDLWLSDMPCVYPNLLLSAEEGSNLLFCGTQIAIEAYTPDAIHPDWLGKIYQFILDNWSRKILDREPEAVSLEWPIEVTEAVQIRYLTFDYRYPIGIDGSLDWYVWVYESIEPGEWTPKYPILFNSLVFSRDFLPESHDQYLSFNQLCLPLPDEVEHFDVYDIETDLETVTQETIVNVQDLETLGCAYGIDPLETKVPGIQVDLLSEAAAWWEGIDQNPTPCTFRDPTLFVYNANLDRVVETAWLAPFIGIRDYTLEEYQAQWNGPVPNQFPPGEYVTGYYQRLYQAQICQVPSEEYNESTETELIRLINEDTDWYNCIIRANNNYWNNGIQRVETGVLPSFYISESDTLDWSNIVLARDRGERIGPAVDYRSESSFNSESETDSYSYWRCLDETENQTNVVLETANYTRETVNISSNSLILGRLPVNEERNDNLLRIDNPVAAIDAYFLANNGMELNIDMPDSIRIKEIHAALEAGFWGDGQSKEFKVFGNDFFSLFTDRGSFGAFVEPALQPESEGFNDQTADTLPQLFRRFMTLLGGFIGIHDFPTLRQPTYVSPIRDAETGQFTREEDPAPIISLYEYLITLDKEVQTKLGLWPAVSYNYAQDEEGVGEPPKRELLNSVAALGSDLFELSTRSSLVTEGARIATLITQDQTFEIIKGMGLMFSVEEVELFEGNFISVPRFNGGASLSAQNLAIAQAIDRSSCTTVLPGSLLDNIGVPQDSPIRTPSGGASRRV